FVVRESEIASTIQTPGQAGAVIVAITATLPAGASLQVGGGQIIGTAVVGGQTTHLVRITESGLKTLHITGQGAAQVQLSVAGDLNRDGRVDSTDASLWQQAQASGHTTGATSSDLNGDGLVNATDRQLLFANTGLKSNQAPVAAAALPTVKTHVDLSAQQALASVAQDLEGERIFWRVIGATHGQAWINADGKTMGFKPEAGYAGAATITVQADDGYAMGAPIELTVNVSDAKLLTINIDRMATLRLGTAQKLSVTGDFEDEVGVVLSGDYLQLTSSNSSVVAVDNRGVVRGIGSGNAIVRIVARGIEGVNAFTVGSDPQYPTLDENGFEVDVYPLAITLPLGGQRQLKVTLPNRSSIATGHTGTRYFISDSNIAEISEDGLIFAKANGIARLSVIHAGMQHDIRLNVVTPLIGQGVVQAGRGLAVQDIQGDNVLMIAPGSLPDGVIASIAAKDLHDLGIPLPAIEQLDALGAFQIELNGGETGLPMQLAIKVKAPVDLATGETLVIPSGTQVAFWRKGSILDTDGTTHETWWLVDNGFVGEDGVARTASPPYSGITGGGGVFVITTLDKSYKNGGVNTDTGEVRIAGALVNFNAIWAQTAFIAMAPAPYAGVAALGIFSSLAAPVLAIKYTLEGSYKRAVAASDFELAKVTIFFPEA
ncbi:MAG: dockerin type I domain-containing protein, partial [Hydrogenophaga sp.]|nr:dockerin type I domain-containing protein [Hydrogenophaga sp.]